MLVPCWQVCIDRRDELGAERRLESSGLAENLFQDDAKRNRVAVFFSLEDREEHFIPPRSPLPHPIVAVEGSPVFSVCDDNRAPIPRPAPYEGKMTGHLAGTVPSWAHVATFPPRLRLILNRIPGNRRIICGQTGTRRAAGDVVSAIRCRSSPTTRRIFQPLTGLSWRVRIRSPLRGRICCGQQFQPAVENLHISSGTALSPTLRSSTERPLFFRICARQRAAR